MKRVALINPGKGEYVPQEPLNLGFIASYLEKNGVDVSIIDEMAGQNVRKELMKYPPDIVGITATTPVVTRAYKLAKMCREMGFLTVMGGVHASALPEEASQHVDIVVTGEGEIAMLDIVRNNITSGIIARSYIRNIDDIPPPARHLMQMEFYIKPKERLLSGLSMFISKSSRSISMLTSRGCLYNCIFCHNSWRGLPVRFNSPERVLSEIEELKRTYGMGSITFMEDDFFANKHRAEKICEMLIEKNFGLVWSANTRVSSIEENNLRKAKEAGCKRLFFGFESGSQRILDILNKRTTVEQNYKAVDLCNKVGIDIDGSFMIGSPTETLEDVEATLEFINNTRIKSLGVMITTPYPGTALWEQCKERRIIPSGFKWEDFNCNYKGSIQISEHLSQEELSRLQLRLIGTAVAKNSRLFLLSKTIRGVWSFRHLMMLLRNPKETIRFLWKVVSGK